MTLLSIENLSVTFHQGNQATQAVRGVSLSINKGDGRFGRRVRLWQVRHGAFDSAPSSYPQASHPTGQIFFDNNEITNKSVLALRGNRIAMIFQEPMTSLNPFTPSANQRSSDPS